MKNKTIKNTFDEKINKKEIYNNVLKTRESRNKFSITHQFAISVTLIILVAVSIILVNSNSRNINAFIGSSSNTKPSIYINEMDKDYTTTYSYSSKVTSSDFNTNEILENQNTSSELKDITLEKKLAIPNDLKQISVEKLYEKEEDKEAIPYIVALYESETKDRKIIIESSLYDIRIKKYDTSKTKSSRIKNIELIIFKEDKEYTSIFKYQNNYYRIITININEDELIELLNSIIEEQ